MYLSLRKLVSRLSVSVTTSTCAHPICMYLLAQNYTYVFSLSLLPAHVGWPAVWQREPVSGWFVNTAVVIVISRRVRNSLELSSLDGVICVTWGLSFLLGIQSLELAWAPQTGFLRQCDLCWTFSLHCLEKFESHWNAKVVVLWFYCRSCRRF